MHGGSDMEILGVHRGVLGVFFFFKFFFTFFFVIKFFFFKIILYSKTNMYSNRN